MVEQNSPNHTLDIPVSEIARSLMERKQVIEDELDVVGNTLSSKMHANVGLNKSLVDSEGFPLPGIDHHEVRALRNKFAILNTDLKTVCDRIEECLHEIHATARLTGEVKPGDRRVLIPFGRVDVIITGSAADDSGMLVGDRITKFGPLSCFSEETVAHCFDSIPGVVRHLVPGEHIEVKVLRVGRLNEDIVLDLCLKESKIGCLIKPVV